MNISSRSRTVLTFLTTLMQQDAGAPGDLVPGPSGIPRVVPSSQLDKEKMLGFKLLLQGGRGVLAVSFLGLEALNLGSEISGLTELKPAPAGRCLNAHLSFAFSGSCLDSSLKGGPGITSKMELGHCKEFWEDERLEGSQVRPGSSPCLPPRRVCQAPHLGRAAPGAPTPGSEARSSPDAGLPAARKR